MNVMAGFWAVCIFTTRKNELLKHGTGGLTMADLTYMDCWHYIAPLMPITSDRMTTEIYVMVFQALKEAEERRKKDG